ncbi:MAG TPA: 2-dehydropantoate 2-reductase [Ramlibacter sp.]|nr:2-dehydropantoate 2-reductase [Ramlibacter sp.]
MTPLRITLLGAGAVGGYFGAPLAAAGHRVSVVARGATLETLRRDGLTLLMEGRRVNGPVQAAEDGARFGPQDVVILAVKAPALPQVAQHVPPLLGPDTIVLPMLNGIPWWFFEGEQRLLRLDPDGALDKAIPRRQVVGAVVFPSLSCPQPGVTAHASGTRVVFGEPEGGTSERVQRVVDLFTQAGLSPEASTDIRREIWLKLLGNACFNPVSMITGSHTDDMLDDELIHELFDGMMRELMAMGRALGIDAVVDPAARMAFSRKLGHIKTSMLQDVDAGRAVELDGILGAAVELAARLGIQAPLLKAVYAIGRRRARELGLYR